MSKSTMTQKLKDCLAKMDPDLQDRLREGFVFCSDLNLEKPLSMISHFLTDNEKKSFEHNPDRTAQLNRIIDILLDLTISDPLTGLFNRRHFDYRLSQELRRSQREQSLCSLMVIDVDNFKTINDQYGHDIGDEILIKVGNALKETLRASDEIARLGGDEFAAILPSTPQQNAVNHVAKRLLEKANQLSESFKVSLSIGVATSNPLFSLSEEELFRRADTALYSAKRIGKNNVRGFDGEEEEQGISADEREALLK